MSMRVVQWSVGGVGRHSLRALVLSDDFDLVGVYSHSDSRIGRDAADLAGLDFESGVVATSEIGDLLALEPDCVVFTSVGETRRREAVGELSTILRSGSNVVSSSMMNLIYPPSAHPKPIQALSEACSAGAATLFTSGIDPGFTGDALPMAALQICQRVDVIRVQEIADYGAHSDPSWATPYGFGKPEGAPAPILEPGVPSLFWGGMVRVLADLLDAEIEHLEEFCDRWYAEETFDVPIGHIERGTLAAVRFGVSGVVGGERRLFAEHVTRMRNDMAPEWPRSSDGLRSVHRVEIEGLPSMSLELQMRGEHDSQTNQGLLATAMRLVNAIPAVVAAPPGLVSALDLKLGIGRHLL